jgi:hypothetical protein
VTVTATSPALQVPSMTTVTNEQGEYRLTPLPFGTYAVEYSLPGFQILRAENVQLTVGFVARLDQVMEVGTLEETVTVSGISPLVDMTSGSTRTTLVGEAIKLLPSGQIGVHALLAQVPGVRANFDVGGSSVTNTAVFIYNGQNGQVWQLIEGVLSGRPNGMGNGTKYDFTVVENARVQTAGNSAEMPKRGMMLDVVTKSGGNLFTGSGQWAQSHHSLEGNNVDDTLRALGIGEAPKMAAHFDRNGQVGGKIIHDRLWFYSSVRLTRSDREVYNVFRRDGSPSVGKDASWFFVNKLSGQLTPQNKIIVFHNVPYAPALNGGNQFTPPEAASSTTETHRVFKTEWQTVRGNWFVASLQLGLYRAQFWGTGADPGVPASFDIVTQMNSGHNLGDTALTTARIYHNRGVVTMYKTDWLRGNHEFKIGFDNTMDRGTVERHDRRPSGNGNYRLRFRSGVPAEIEIHNFPSIGVTQGFYLGGYAQDSWTLARRLTLNLGFRVAHDASEVPEQCQLAGGFEIAFPTDCTPTIKLNVWNSFAPRLHAVYDLTGDGRSVIKGGWGRFKKKREVQGYEVTLLNLNTPRFHIYRWVDRNGNRDYNPGEVNLDPNGPDYLSSGRTGTDVSVTNLTTSFLNRDELQPYEDEFTIGFERQLVQNLAARVSGVYAVNRNVPRILNPLLPYEAYTIPITSADPGPDGVVGNADDPGRTLTYYDFPAEFRGAKFQAGQLVNNDPRNDTKYWTVEFALAKRLAQNWQFSASHSLSWKRVPFGDAAATAVSLNPNAEIHVADNTGEWITKMSASYLLPKGILASVNYDLRSGTPLARQVLLRGGASIPQLVVNAEPLGSISLPAIRLLDLRAAKQFDLVGTSRMEVYLDLFNVLNFNGATSINVRSGPTYLYPTAISPPRILQVGGRFSF